MLWSSRLWKDAGPGFGAVPVGVVIRLPWIAPAREGTTWVRNTAGVGLTELYI